MWLLVPYEECLMVAKAWQQAAGPGIGEIASSTTSTKHGEETGGSAKMWSLKLHPQPLYSSSKTVPPLHTAPPAAIKQSNFPNYGTCFLFKQLYPFFFSLLATLSSSSQKDAPYKLCVKYSRSFLPQSSKLMEVMEAGAGGSRSLSNPHPGNRNKCWSLVFFLFLFNPGSQLKEWCHIQLWWFFPLRLTESR